MARVVPFSDAALAEAAALLASGGAVAFATETVYGLGASTLDAAAIARVYALKRRPADNPLIAHVLDAGGAAALARTWDARATSLAARFWPGPLTLVVPRQRSVPSASTAGGATIAIRSPAHPAARALLAAFGGPLSAPSANRSGHVSPTRAEHVAEEFPDQDLLVLDAGPCPIGLESTVIDLSGPIPRLLRPGSIGLEALIEVVGPVEAMNPRRQDLAPGTRERHYAPRTPLTVVPSERLDAELAAATGPAVLLALAPRASGGTLSVLVMPPDAVSYATALYAALRDADRQDARAILVEKPPDSGPLWLAIHDRLARASAGRE